VPLLLIPEQLIVIGKFPPAWIGFVLAAISMAVVTMVFFVGTFLPLQHFQDVRIYKL